MLTRLANVAMTAPKRVLAVALIVLVMAGYGGATVADRLSSGGFTVEDAESTRASELLDERFHSGAVNLALLVDATDVAGGADSDAARTVGQDAAQTLADREDWFTGVQSYWTAPEESREQLVSRDGTSALVVATIRGDDDVAQDRAAWVIDELSGPQGDITVSAGGSAVAYHQVNEQTTEDLTRAEMIAIPLTGLALVIVFGSLIAAMVPLAVGIFAIVASLGVLRVLVGVTDVSIYALNMTTALGLALAIDYSLFMVSRYREELAAGRPRPDALRRTVQTAGRTVLFSALTVALALAALAVFPMYFLRSFAYAGLITVALAALASILVLPAVLTLMGRHIDRFDLRRGIRRLLGRPEPEPKTVEQRGWYRLAMRVMRRPALFGLAVVALLVALGSPFLQAQFGYPDDRVLTSSQSARSVGDQMRDDFTLDATGSLSGVVTDVDGDVAAYTSGLSSITGVDSVTSSAGVFSDGRQVAPAPDGYAVSADGERSVRLDITSDVEPFSPAGQELVDDVRAAEAPGEALWTGWSAFNADAMTGLAERLPLALALIIVSTFIVLFLFTGSIVVPIKALVLNTLSLTAMFGAMVWVFQEGHLSDVLGFTATGFLVANMVVLMFCLAFGMSMDYEVFLLSRIREAWDASGKTVADNQRAVALGVGHTGRIITAAAVIMSIVFAAMLTSSVQFMKLFGLGITLAILADATLVRGILVPAFMRLMGRANWWAPAPLARLHQRFGLREAADDKTDELEPTR